MLHPSNEVQFRQMLGTLIVNMGSYASRDLEISLPILEMFLRSLREMIILIDIVQNHWNDDEPHRQETARKIATEIYRLRQVHS